ncbi:MAG: LCP family protein, partial [Actinomycetota bacterium]|nr:LCP family protein [Actinomycetota bacterium]
MGTAIFACVAIVLTAGGYVYVRWRLGQIHRVKNLPLSQDGQVMNVLLVGSDSRANLTGDLADQAGKNQVTGQRSDTIMILHIDSVQKKAAILSVPRDLYVHIAGTTKSDRVNSSFSTGGPSGLINTVQENLGVTLTHYMEVDFVGFRDIVNTVGGISIYVPAPARDAFSGLDIKTPGCVSFDGDKALAWVRSRHYQYFEGGRWQEDPRSDLGRIQRQQDFIRRMLKKAVSSGLTNPLALNRLIGIGVKDVTIDDKMSTSDMVTLGKKFRSLNADTVDMLTLPTTPVTVGGADVLRLNKQEAQPFIDRINGKEPPPAPGPAAPPRPGEVRVRVLNGNGSQGGASKARADLQKPGFNVADTGDADSYKYRQSVIRYAPGQLPKAQLLQSYLQAGAGAKVEQDNTLKTVDLTLVMGTDYTGIRDAPAPAPAPAPPPTTVAAESPVPQPNGAPAH